MTTRLLAPRPFFFFCCGGYVSYLGRLQEPAGHASFGLAWLRCDKPPARLVTVPSWTGVCGLEAWSSLSPTKKITQNKHRESQSSSYRERSRLGPTAGIVGYGRGDGTWTAIVAQAKYVCRPYHGTGICGLGEDR